MNYKKKHTGKAKLNRILTVLFLCMFLFSLYKAANILLEYRNIERLYDETLVQYTSEENETDKAPIEVDLAELRDVNEDICGWIYIPDTNVNFPLLQGKSNKQYLFQSYKKEYLTAGSIFIDYRCRADLTDKNTVIYGHNMHNGSMFGKLKKYADEDYRNEHPYVYLMRADGRWNKYEIIAYFQAAVDGALYDLPIESDCSEERFERLKEAIAEENLYGESADLSESDQLITLSTCTRDSRNDVRVVVIAKLVPSA